MITLEQYILSTISDLPEFPNIDIESFTLLKTVPYPWDGFDFINSENFVIQLSYQGRVKVYTPDNKIIFESQL